MTQSEKLFDLKKLSREGGFKIGNIISVDPEIYKKYEQHMRKTVKHDTKIQNITFKVCLSAYSKNPLNFGLKGYSSIGKTYVVTETIKYFPETDVWLLGGLSKKALLVHPVLRLRETEISEEIIRSIFGGDMKDLKTKAFESFFEIFVESYNREESEKIARLAVDLLGPLVEKRETRVKEKLEEFL